MTKFCPSCRSARDDSEFTVRVSKLTGRSLSLCNACWEAKAAARTREGRKRLSAVSRAKRDEERRLWSQRLKDNNPNKRTAP